MFRKFLSIANPSATWSLMLNCLGTAILSSTNCVICKYTVIFISQICCLTNLLVTIRLGTQWKDDICYREPLTEISRLPPRPTPSVAVPAPIFPKRDQDDPLRRDSGMSTGSLEMESAESADVEPVTHDMTGWWEPRIKVNLADQLPGNLFLFGCCLCHLYAFPCIKFRKHLSHRPTWSVPVSWC
jgi:hypothetical protein